MASSSRCASARLWLCALALGCCASGARAQQPRERHHDLSLAVGVPVPLRVYGDDASLRQALTDIIGAQVSCDVTLQGSVQSGDPCGATVELNSQKLGCKDKDGWELIDPKHIRLLGKACSDFKTVSNAQVHARFPCDVQIVF